MLRRPHFARPALLVLLPLTAALGATAPADDPRRSEGTPAETTAPRWPEIRAETKPWSRWWWFGNIADEPSLTARLEQAAAVGLGGLEITPIYGVRGYEERFVDFLSPRWMELLRHTLSEAHRLDLGIDLATGTGWPFGGPWLDEADAAHFMTHRVYAVAAGERLREPVALTPAGLVGVAGARQVRLEELRHPVTTNANLQELALDQVRFARPLRLVSLMAYPSPAGQAADLARSAISPRLPTTPIDLTARVGPDGTLDWTAPAGNGAWTLYALFEGSHGKMVERAAPGGEGLALDHFSSAALGRYLARFDAAFAGAPAVPPRTTGGSDTADGRRVPSSPRAPEVLPARNGVRAPPGTRGALPQTRNDDGSLGLRAFFNDSYEVDDAEGEANWTPQFLAEFQRRRGYDLRTRLPELFAAANPDLAARVRSDYRETISDLLLEEFTQPWRAWAQRHGARIRNQAHNAPAHLLDLYAASDIPEQEGNGFFAMKLASSAAHVTGKPLASAETATWLNEHFLTTLAELKHNTDDFLLAGINHVCYHGTAFSPLDAGWPGFNFYASVELNPANPFWPDFAALNSYVARAQSFLQSGTPDEDVLLYYNIHDRWAADAGDRLPHFGHGVRDPVGVTAGQTAAALREAGLGFDYVSDRMLASIEVGDRTLVAAGARYRALVVPATQYMPRATLARLFELAADGATILVERQLPAEAPGIAGLQQRKAFALLLRRIQDHSTTEAGLTVARIGAGRVVIGPDLPSLLAQRSGLRGETLRQYGLEFVRRRAETGARYLLVNRGAARVDGWIPLQAPARAAVIYDLMHGRAGVAALRPGTAAGAPIEVYLQLEPGESCIVQLHREAVARTPWTYRQTAGEPTPLAGRWSVAFTRGGPTLPARATLETPATGTLPSWTEFAGDAGRAFSGTAVYAIEFPLPAGDAPAWQLDLGTVCDSARVTLNGRELATVLQPPWQVTVPRDALRPHNSLEIAVTNLAANRIADLDRRGVAWKRFYNANFPARRRENVGPDGLFTAAHWPPRNSGLLGPVMLTPLQALDPRTVAAGAEPRPAAPRPATTNRNQ